MDINKIHEQAELSQAAYADLIFGDLDGQDRVLEEESKILAAQATNLASRYEVALATYNEPVSSFSATVFKSSDSGDLTLAIRGSGVDDWITTNPDIYSHGAGYAQIVALYNWWQKVSASSGQMVKQFAYKTYIDGVDSVPEGALLLYKSENGGPLSFERSTYLVPMPDVAATGELAGALAVDSNHKVAVTGHSLGGHLAMVFGSLFFGATEAVTMFNAPGFKSSAINQSFFQTLNGAKRFPTIDYLKGIKATQWKQAA